MFLLNSWAPRLSTRLQNFNTSHVSIKRFGEDLIYLLDDYFNTSHVSIKHTVLLSYPLMAHYFNTSHVSIKQEYIS